MNRSIWLILVILTLPSSCSSQSQTGMSIRGKSQQLVLYGTRGNPPILLSSGDLGWAGLVEHVAEFLSSRGYFIVGVNSKAYLSSFTTKTSALNPQDVPRDYQVLIDFARQGSTTKPLLAGVSEGAGLSVLAATEASIKTSARGIAAAGPPGHRSQHQDERQWNRGSRPSRPERAGMEVAGLYDLDYKESPERAEFH